MSAPLGSLNRLAKWRMVFAGWQLGTRGKGDPESDAVRDHRELTILLRAEVNTLTGLLVRKGIVTAEEWQDVLGQEAEALNADYERRFPGFSTDDNGVHMKLPEAGETMKGWLP